jgi:hypothetical protein
MVKPVSLRFRNAAILQEARATLARLAEDDRLRRCKRHAGFKALHAVRLAYQLEEKVEFPSMSEIDQKRWRERRQMVEAELNRIAEFKPS